MMKNSARCGDRVLFCPLNLSSTVETAREQHEYWDSYDWHLHLRDIKALIFGRWFELHTCVCADDNLHEQRKHPSGSAGCGMSMCMGVDKV